MHSTLENITQSEKLQSISRASLVLATVVGTAWLFEQFLQHSLDQLYQVPAWLVVASAGMFALVVVAGVIGVASRDPGTYLGFAIAGVMLTVSIAAVASFGLFTIPLALACFAIVMVRLSRQSGDSHVLAAAAGMTFAILTVTLALLVAQSPVLTCSHGSATISTPLWNRGLEASTSMGTNLSGSITTGSIQLSGRTVEFICTEDGAITLHPS